MSTSTAKRNAIELIRVSTARQAEKDRYSIPAQKAETKRIAEANGLTIVETIEYSDVGGSDVIDTSEMQYLLKRIEDRSIVGVVAFHFSRLMRPEKGREFSILDKFAETKTNIYLPSMVLELASPQGRFMARTFAAMAGLEKEELKLKMFSNKEQRRRAGLCPSASICLPGRGKFVGFDRTTDKW